MTAQLSPFLTPAAYDQCTIGGVKCPGIVEIDAEYGIKEDEKTGPGVDGAVDTIQGRKLQPFSIKIKFGFIRYDGTTPEDAGDWEAVEKLIDIIKPAKAAALPVDVANPIVQMWRCKSCLILNAKGPTMDESGLWVLTISAKEFRAPPKKPATVTPNKSSTDTYVGDVEHQVQRSATELATEAARKIAQAAMPFGASSNGAGRTVDNNGNNVAPGGEAMPQTLDPSGNPQDGRGAVYDASGNRIA